ncbi:MAG TPA: FCD domain-containing protein [Solirubrobacteraceae bacterium]|nr:FCD domain-containing protein [Solirubrobacteraceae bacterium]
MTEVAPRAFEHILGELEASISAGVLEAGDRLPPERDLAARFGVSRASVREAIRVLEAMGVVSVRRGAEHGVVLLQEPGNAFQPVLRLLVALRHVSLDDTIEFRVMVEAGAARSLATAGASADELGELLDRMEAPGVKQPDFHALDATFHVTLVRTAGNALLDLVEDAVDGLLRKIVTDLALIAWDWEAVRPRLIAEHRAIHDAIVAGDGERAAALVTQHIRYWGHRVKGS